ncbi:MFS transporter [Actinoplanes oblitus]|uniref:MFS transporter n=1 Tax=Actinoplanes oblitus TaxID=3040509 RepID=A0ABY8WTJ5_9ACTN|nr:MFS transporter [Actinoplanes oblitus]WIN00221.1 MFS transporter [Actinoplanes oblitus]
MSTVLSPPRRLLSASFVSQVGNWLTFTGLAQHVQSHYGSAATAAAFVTQSLPSLLFVRAVVERIPPSLRPRVYYLTQIGLAVLSLSLVIGTPLPYVLVFFALSALLRGIANPLYMALVGEWVPSQDRSAIYISLGAIGSVTLALSPAVGGVIAIAFGLHWLVVIDAASFLLGLAILRTGPAWRPASGPSRPDEPPSMFTLRGLFGRPPGLTGSRAQALTAWTWLSLIGAAVNAVELPVFALIHHFDTRLFGYALSCYGLGGLATLFLRRYVADREQLLPWLSGGYLVSIAAWVFGGDVGAYAGFFGAGLTYGLLNGVLRGLLDRSAQAGGVDAVPLWAWANQVVIVSNLVVYGVATAAFAAGMAPAIGGLVLVGLCLAFVAQSIRVVFRPAVPSVSIR